MRVRRALLLLTAGAVWSCGGDSAVAPPPPAKTQLSLTALRGTTLRLTSVNGASLPAISYLWPDAARWADSATITFQADSVLAMRAYYGNSNAPNTSRAPGPSQFFVSKTRYSVSSGVVLLTYAGSAVPDTLIPVAGGFDVRLTQRDSVQPPTSGATWRFATAWNGGPLFPIPTITSYVMLPPGGDLAVLARSLPFSYGTILLIGSSFTTETDFPSGGLAYQSGLPAPMRAAYMGDTLMRIDNVPVTWFLTGAHNPITMVNPAPGGGPASIRIDGTNPTPVLTSISPASGAVSQQGTRIELTGANFTTATTVLWDGSPVPTFFTSSTQLVGLLTDSVVAKAGTFQVSVSTPSPGGGVSASFPFTLTGVAAQLLSYTTSSVTLSARFMVADPVRPLVYVATDEYEATYTNSVVAIDIATGAIAWTLPVGGSPNVLAVSEDGQFLYVGGMGLNKVVRINLDTHTSDLSIPLGGDSLGLFRARDLAAVPSEPRAVAVNLGYVGTSTGPSRSIMVFDDSVARPVSSTLNPGEVSLVVGGNAATLYAYEVSSPDAVLVIDVSAAEVTARREITRDRLGQGSTMIQAAGHLFFSDGAVVDTVASSPSATLVNFQSGYALGYHCLVPSSDGTTVYAVYNNHLIAWDSKLLTQIGSLALPAVEWPANFVTRWGSDGIAYLQNGQVHFIRASLVH